MPNVVLERLREQRAEQIATIDAILAQVGEDRDLVDAERSLLEAARERIAEIDAQIEPLAAFETMREAHDETVRALPRPEAVAARPAGHDPRAFPYATPGAFVVDYLRAHGMIDGSGERGRDELAAGRVQAAYQARADQTTADTPGLLPRPIVGAVVSLIDANRPLVTSLGVRPLGGIPGLTFQRPKITTHTTVGPQTAEKTALPSQKMTITPVNFTKQTYGGYVDISRQDIDFTSPAAWDILVRDLADVYAVQTETAVAANVVADAGTAVALAGPALADWTKALYTAAMHSYQIGKRMPTHVWCALDVWAALGSLVDTTRVVFPQNTSDEMGAPGTATLADFRGDVLGLPRVVVPTFAAGTCIVGPADLYEVYEDMIGLLSVIEPSILGVQVAYGGYIADGTTSGAAFIPITTTAGALPTLAEADQPAPTAANGGRRNAEAKA